MPLRALMLAVAAGYLIGAIPTGVIVGKLYRGVDVRQYGSRRTGATNVLRTLGPGASAVVLSVDLAKGAAVVLVARLLLGGIEPAWWSHVGEVLAALCALAGHNWPVYIGFRGGRGVAVAGGSMFALLPTAAAIALAVGLLVMALSRFVSLGSLAATMVAALLIVLWVIVGSAPPPYLIFSVVASAVIFLQHRDNIERLRAGTERKLGQQESASSPFH